jgi:hypothetical protein
MLGIRRFAATCAVALAIASLPSAAGDLWKAYVFAFVTAKEAKAVCPAARINEMKLIVLRARTVREADESAVDAEIVRMKPIVQGGVLKSGAIRWCLAVANMFGDHGDLAPGLIDFN